MRPQSFRPYSTILAGLLGAVAFAAVPAWAQSSAQSVASPARLLSAADLANGRALYQSACDMCHSQNIHWREKRLARSWELLVKEVTRWQSNAGRHWESSEIRDVAAYLNERFYQLPCPPDECMDKQAAAR